MVTSPTDSFFSGQRDFVCVGQSLTIYWELCLAKVGLPNYLHHILGVTGICAWTNYLHSLFGDGITGALPWSRRRPETDLPNFLSKEGYKVHDKTTFHGTTHIVSDYHIIWLKYLSNHAEKIQFI